MTHRPDHRAPLAVAALLFCAAACSSGHPSVVSNCGYLYTVHGLGSDVHVGGCSGGPSATEPTRVVARVGDTFKITSVREQNGDPDMQAPTSDDPAVVVRVGVSHQGGDGRYRAVRSGTTTLRTSTVFCLGPIDTAQTPGRPPKRICPVLQVTVTAN